MNPKSKNVNLKTNQNQSDNFKTRRDNTRNQHIKTISHIQLYQQTHPSNYFSNKNTQQNYQTSGIIHLKCQIPGISNQNSITSKQYKSSEIVKQISEKRKIKQNQNVNHFNDKVNVERKDSANIEKKQIVLRRQSNSKLSSNLYTPIKMQQTEYLKTETKRIDFQKKQVEVKEFNYDIQKELKILKSANQRLDHSLKNSRKNCDFIASRRIINSQVEKNSKAQQKQIQNLIIEKRYNNDRGCVQLDMTIKTIKDLDNQKHKLNKEIKLKNKQLQKHLIRQNQLITENMKAKQNIQRLIQQNSQMKNKLEQLSTNNSRLYELLKNKIKENQNISNLYQNQLRKAIQMLRYKEEQVDILKFQIQKLFESCNVETKSRTSITSILNEMQKRNQTFTQDSQRMDQVHFQNSRLDESMINDLITKDIQIDKLKNQNEKLTKIINQTLSKIQFPNNTNNDLFKSENVLKNHYENLVNDLYKKDMKIAELQSKLKKITQQQKLERY